MVHARYGHPLCFYIRPHFRKCGAVVPLKLHLVPRTATRPSGFQNRPYAKCPSLESGRTAIGASRSLRALRTVVCTSLWGAWPCFHSGAARCVFYSVAYGRTSCVCPAHPRRRRCAALARAVCPSAPRAPSVRAQTEKRSHDLPQSSASITGKFAESAYIHRYIAGKEKTPLQNQ